MGERAEEGEIYLKMPIPNKEINLIYRNTVLSWFDKRVRGTDLSLFAWIIERGDCEAFGNFLSDCLKESAVMRLFPTERAEREDRISL